MTNLPYPELSVHWQKATLVHLGLQALAHGDLALVAAITRLIQKRRLGHA